jgi:hypothetical protein
MANPWLIALLIVLILIVGGPLLFVAALGTALRVTLWILLALLVIGLVSAFVGGGRAAARY